jgi:hypothetical protein
MTSATEIRSAWPTLNEKRKTALVMSLYPKTQTTPNLAATVVKLLDTALGVVDESALENLPRPNKRNQFKSLHKQRKQRGLDEQGVGENQGWAATFTNEDDYIEEKWSSKYKNSINCAAPQGFSQRAHCAGRKK